ncbi:polysaccharide biosynthesis C-terminal domain-containing protein [Enterococcus faecium]|uniref:polysaccharide biosynthesis C-terminal domain-containing protein n=3 Tax=Enterococcus faecium TaxID=1352 RepID=UPI001F5C1868|nr:polysaccharide biosynthesis C-terminal domain-containing protein [Enterococcus faecium]MCU1817718.1 polysaccharide biosynthesis C-terminal domain-containing protein [Enterococcus faecium]MCU1830470.1 polysaccharide biosynthesis C-terminal domain-containing protein [Enterococcus faecium]MCU1948191.1 polysaccharide biosynthesis C-terminal domain-containing protein [Enterococcus faecium]MCY7002382.1 polysaccharide biosynthesis C-terminal domain-containing protein [Enterococcus faecium]MDW78508
MNAILIPVFNQNGAAIASVITETLVTMLMTLYCGRLTKIMIRAKDVYTVMISGVLMGGFIWGLEQITKFKNHLMLLILDMLVGLSVYTVSLVVTKNDLSELILEKIRVKMRK